MKKKILSVILSVVAAASVGVLSSGTASAEAKWHGPYSSKERCTLASQEFRGMHWIGIKTFCEKHADGKWWYQTRW